MVVAMSWCRHSIKSLSSRRLFDSKPVQMWISGKQSSTRTGFSTSSLVFPCIIPPKLHIIHSPITDAM